LACKAELPVVVVGGGITGAFSAYSLARLGVRVTLVERGELAGQASGSNAGGLNPLHGPGIPGPMQELALQSLRLHREGWEQLGASGRARAGARLVGRLQVAMNDAEATELEAASCASVSRASRRTRLPGCGPKATRG
jgi:glycine/D-amino acid oxidase-like deaminating enzyme